MSCLKSRNTHVQNKHNEQLWSKICDRHRILKDKSWMCLLHQYHKASRLKPCTAMGQEREEFVGKFPI